MSILLIQNNTFLDKQSHLQSCEALCDHLWKGYQIYVPLTRVQREHSHLTTNSTESIQANVEWSLDVCVCACVYVNVI